jgi:hypothetical protein
MVDEFAKEHSEGAEEGRDAEPAGELQYASKEEWSVRYELKLRVGWSMTTG